MQKVYILITDECSGDNRIQGVYSSKEAARREFKKILDEGWWDWVEDKDHNGYTYDESIKHLSFTTDECDCMYVTEHIVED